MKNNFWTYKKELLSRFSVLQVYELNSAKEGVFFSIILVLPTSSIKEKLGHHHWRSTPTSFKHSREEIKPTSQASRFSSPKLQEFAFILFTILFIFISSFLGWEIWVNLSLELDIVKIWLVSLGQNQSGLIVSPGK